MDFWNGFFWFLGAAGAILVLGVALFIFRSIGRLIGQAGGFLAALWMGISLIYGKIYEWLGKLITSVIAFVAITVLYWYGVDDRANYLDFIQAYPRIMVGGMLAAFTIGALRAATKIKLIPATIAIVVGTILISWLVSGLRFPQFVGRARGVVVETACQAVGLNCGLVTRSTETNPQRLIASECTLEVRSRMSPTTQMIQVTREWQVICNPFGYRTDYTGSGYVEVADQHGVILNSCTGTTLPERLQDGFAIRSCQGNGPWHIEFRFTPQAGQTTVRQPQRPTPPAQGQPQARPTPQTPPPSPQQQAPLGWRAT